MSTPTTHRHPTRADLAQRSTRAWTAVQRRSARLAAATVTLAALLAIAGFTALGSVFDYPQILHEPVEAILAQFRQHQTAVMAWFGVLVVGAALLAPAGIWLGRLAGGRLGVAIAGFGGAAAVVQVVGLQRWLTLVPGIAAGALDPVRHVAAVREFSHWHTLLGQVVGETFGYAFSAVFTALVAYALGRSILPGWLVALGYASAVLIATGVLVPVIGAASVTNFVGYILWCGWLLAVAFALVRAARSNR